MFSLYLVLQALLQLILNKVEHRMFTYIVHLFRRNHIARIIKENVSHAESFSGCYFVLPDTLVFFSFFVLAVAYKQNEHTYIYILYVLYSLLQHFRPGTAYIYIML